MKPVIRRLAVMMVAAAFAWVVSGCSDDDRPTTPRTLTDTNDGAWEIQIETTENTIQGLFVDIDLTMNHGTEVMYGFDLLIGYNAEALAFVEATLGDYLLQCDWEYFTYRYNWNGNCGDDCPSGLARLFGMADINNGANHPDYECLQNAAGHTIATLTFFVSNDRTLECTFVPIQFYWMDCNDNSIALSGGDSLAISRSVFDADGNPIHDFDCTMPGYSGAPDDSCLIYAHHPTFRYIDLINGGVDIICIDIIDWRGDLNVNGIPYEIADAVTFTEYFLIGIEAFDGHVDASIAASDVNADGEALTVADLIYLIRVIMGDAQPYPKPPPNASATVTMQNDQVIIDCPVDVGAALFIFDVTGEPGIPVVNAAGMDLKYAYDGGQLRALVYHIGAEYIPTGKNAVLTVPGQAELIEAELGAYDGYPIGSQIAGRQQLVHVTNYPNPFTASTTITMSFAREVDWSLSIFTVGGREIKSYSGHASAGTYQVQWDATDNAGHPVAPGAYFYRVTVDDGETTCTATKWLVYAG